MNKTVVFVAIAGITIVGVCGIVLLVALDKDAQPVISMLGTTLAVVISAALTLGGLQQVAQQQEKISKNVNGNTSRLLGLVQRDALTPDEAEDVARIENDNRDLVAKYEGKHLA